MITVKLSYSILNAYAMGRWEEAIAQYLGKPYPTTPAMELGKAKDKIWTEYAMEHKQLHDELGGDPLANPILQQKYAKTIPLGDKYQILIRGVPDCTDGETIYEFKCGRTEASAYVESMQFDYYKFLVPELKLGIYKCFNPYTKRLSVGIKYLDDKNAERALNHIITFGSELITQLEADKLLIDHKD